ncbi:Sec8 exocyst complex component-specific domain-containing protein [Calycina marina]|uniref:Exocyst complex component Sec8 n=1 Tax=Calycina marina TaxID=1763456 RepID=A0A9P8CJ85_9HELO|nr:Sec8 exocyst complex component-specific domain-containing protein [Calycina marina]
MSRIRNRYGLGGGQDLYSNGTTESQSAEPDYDPYATIYENAYGSPVAPPARMNIPTRSRAESTAERRIGDVLDRIQAEWPEMCKSTCVPVHISLQLLDSSSVGRQRERPQFEQMHSYLQESLKAIVHEHHQGFNSSIGTFHKIQSSIQTSQKRVRVLKDSLIQSKSSLGTTDPELRKMASASQNYDHLIRTLSEIEDLRLVPDQLEARISEKLFLTAVDVLQDALRRIRVPALDEIGALSELRSYLTNQESALTDILVEELHDHLYLKSPYCQERWQVLAKGQGGLVKEKPESTTPVRPFYEVLDSMDLTEPMVEDPSKNPESDTFSYIGLLVESLNKLGRLESAVNTIKERLPNELFGIVNETNAEVDQKHPSSLRGGISHSTESFGKENGLRAEVIYDLLWTLYAKLEAVAEGHRVFHDVMSSIVRREGVGDSKVLLGSFTELWTLYQNEIKTLLNTYITTEADIYQHNSTPRPGASKDQKREQLFQFSSVDAKSAQMTADYQELDGIIRAAVPGLMASNRKQAESKKHNAQRAGSTIGSRRTQGTSNVDNKAAHKSLVEPSVFNMSLLLPSTIAFLKRLKMIVPPRSDIVTSTLTSFLDAFLKNVFRPQLEETLEKLSYSLFNESDAFQEDPQWTNLARRPLFKGTTAFFSLIMAFCRMLDTIPHDQAISQIIIDQMMKYYNHCYGWFKTLVAKSDAGAQKLSATLATGPGEIHDVMHKLWSAEGDDHVLLKKEADLLILHTNEIPLRLDDIIMDRNVISSLSVLYTSMKWLSIKINELRHITRSDMDSNRNSVQRPQTRRWTLINESPRSCEAQSPAYLPMSQETVVNFDSIVSSFQECAGVILLTLHMEIRCQIIFSLTIALSPAYAPYSLEQVVKDPDPRILSLNADLVSYDETADKFLREREISFIRSGLALLIDSFLVTNAGMVKAMNGNGCGRMQLNILVMQQNLKNIEAEVNLNRSARFFDLFMLGPGKILEESIKNARSGQEKTNGRTGSDNFSYEELKILVELCYSEQLEDPERGISSVAKRHMDEHLLQLSEHMWQS